MFENRNLKQNFKVFFYLYKVQFMYWRQNKMNLALGVGVSLYTMICWLAFKSDDPFLMISGISVGLVRNAMYIQVKTVSDWKTKGVFSRINSTPTSTFIKNAASIAFNITSTAAICVFMFVVALIFFPEQRTILSNANHGIVWAGLILGWLTSYYVGYAIVNWIPNGKIAQMTGLLLYFSTMYFLGLGFPFEVIVKVQWLNDILYIHPFRYTMNIVQAGFINAPNFYVDNPNYFGGEILDFGFGKQNWLPYFLSFVMIFLYAGAYHLKNYFDLSFHKRNKYGKFIVNKSSSRYIHRLKTSQTIEEAKMLHKDHLETLSKSSPKMKKIIQQIQRELRVEEWFKYRNKKNKKNE